MSTSQPAIDSTDFRHVCGQFASGVTVVTTARGTSAHGMTATAFMSVSLDPALIAISVDDSATMHDWLHETGRYGVSVLAEWQEAHCWHFAGEKQAGLDVAFTWVKDTPLIDHALAHFVADVVDAHPAGDHTIFVGRVRHLQTEATDAQPLIVHDGAVTRLLQEKTEGYTWHPSWR